MIDDSMLDVMSSQDLRMLMAKIQNKIARKSEDEKLEAIRQIQEIAHSIGMTAEQLLGVKKKRSDAGMQRDSYSRKGQKPRRKYRNPDNHEQTWAGGGNQPVWVREGLERGMQLEDFLNPDA